MTADTLENIRTRINSRYTMLFLDTWEEERWEAELSKLVNEINRTLVVWSATEGPQPGLVQEQEDAKEPLTFLHQISDYGPNQVFLLKDFRPYLTDPLVVRKLRDLAAELPAQNKTLLFMGPETEIPLELLKEAVKLELPLPGAEEIGAELGQVLNELADAGGSPLQVNSEQEERLVKAVLGLSLREARKSLARALIGRDSIDEDVYSFLVAEKGRMVQGSDMLEFQELGEGVKDVGGLEGLKDWILKRAQAFSNSAREQGIPAPKGVLLLGVQGCGKSLTSRAIAKLLSFPLVRLDVSSLLSSDRGSSEKNMREVLQLMETVAPAILWLDEIEKGFAGTADGSAQDSTMLRLVGRFLTWMQENDSSVFVVATANSVTGLPPEMLRRGRFDELFFIDLPNYHERIEIFNIHLKKRGWNPEDYDVASLAEKTEGYSGAEIEQVVLSAMVETFGNEDGLTQNELDRAREDSVPLSVTMEEKIFELREWARTRCRPATPDSRVLQMLEQEQRQSAVEEVDDEDDEPPIEDESIEDQPVAEEPQPEEAETSAPGALDDDFFFDDEKDDDPEKTRWISLAENGDVGPAIVEFIRQRDQVTFSQLIDSFTRFINTKGDQILAVRDDPNVVIWAGLHQDMAGPLAKLLTGGKLYLRPTEVERYRQDNSGLKLPILEAMPEDKLSKPTWLPTTITDLAPENGDGRLSNVARLKVKK